MFVKLKGLEDRKVRQITARSFRRINLNLENNIIRSIQEFNIFSSYRFIYLIKTYLLYNLLHRFIYLYDGN